ncbi:hypothetical protein L0244_28455, partial [bacterium]|nr:hypothetical protein [bacterium]
SDVLLFDVVDPLKYQGLDAVKKRFATWVTSFEGPVGYEILDLNIFAGESVAFSHWTQSCLCNKERWNEPRYVLAGNNMLLKKRWQNGWLRMNMRQSPSIRKQGKHRLILSHSK